MTRYGPFLAGAIATSVVAFFCAAASAAPVTPTRDDEVVERLPARVAGLRPLRELDARTPRDPHEAVVRARALLEDARDRGDPRYVGYALAAIAPWRDDAAAPAELIVLRATLAQYQHDFDGARRQLEAVVARQPGDSQALLTLATIARVQGRYDDSDATCRRIPARLYAGACVAENLALRGRFDEARKMLDSLLATPLPGGSQADGVRQWLTTTRAELEERAGDDAAARAAFAVAMRLGRDAYLTLDEADHLIDTGQPAAAIELVRKEPQPYGDGVLLRLAIAARALRAADAAAYADELRARFDAARERGDAISIHGRELARFLDVVEGRPRDALPVARENLKIQKEPADFLVMASAARNAGDRAALQEVASAARTIGLVDRRLDALTRPAP